MKTSLRIISIMIIGITLMFNGCRKNNDDATIIETGTVTDVDDNSYKTIKIGDLWWMSENLKTTHYQDGSAIENVTDSAAWEFLTTGAYCWCDNDPALKNTYGAYYNWYTIADDRNLCPAGWHVPSQSEWNNLIGYLGGDYEAGEKIVSHKIDFPAVYGGYRTPPGNFYGSNITYIFWYVGRRGDWWTSTRYDYSSDYAICTELISKPLYPYTAISCGGGSPMYYGIPVRCVKN